MEEYKSTRKLYRRVTSGWPTLSDKVVSSIHCMYHGTCKFNNHNIAAILFFETRPTSDASDALSSLSVGTSEEYEWEFWDTTT
jgi:hypothetical protein